MLPVSLINDFEDITFAILKHNNACGLASSQLKDAWEAALLAIRYRLWWRSDYQCHCGQGNGGRNQ